MISTPIVAGAFLLVAVGVMYGTKVDSPSQFVPRLFLSVGLAAWAVFYLLRGPEAPTMAMVAVTRWLHMFLLVGVGLVAWARWYLAKKLNGR